MTRINLVPVQDLHHKHLVAEYREIARIHALALAAHGKNPDHTRFPDTYRLGTGHVLFFYARMGFIIDRQHQLHAEMLRRNYKPAHAPPTSCPLPPSWQQPYTPTQAALALSAQRIADRTSPSWSIPTRPS